MDLSKLRAASAKRMVNGVEVPRQNTTSFGVRAALKKGGSNYAGESGEVEGEASRPRLDRPARKNGGCVKKADGGAIDGGKRITSMDEYEADHPPSITDGLRGLGRAMFNGKAFESQTQSEPTRHGDGVLLKNYRERKALQNRKSGGKVGK